MLLPSFCRIHANSLTRLFRAAHIPWLL